MHDKVIKYISCACSADIKDFSEIHKAAGIPFDEFRAYSNDNAVMLLSGLSYPVTRLNRMHEIVSANLIQKSTKKKPDSIKDHIVLDINGFKLGVVGAMGAELESSIKSSRIEDFEFSNDTNLLKDAITSCEDEGAKSTILVLHDDKDSTYTNTIQSSKLNFKGIFGGHSHS